jgi:hypothetical protein
LQDFSETIHPVSFFVYVRVRTNVEWPNICSDNGQTKERLVVKTINPYSIYPISGPTHPKKLMLISRYPARANKDWIKANEQEIIKWNVYDQNRLIRTE